MRLLDPKELNTKLNDQKKSEYDAGMFLAKKIDRLREDLAEAQKLHDDTIHRINQEFEEFSLEKEQEREILNKEIESRKEELRLLKIPLDSEWEKVNEESKNLFQIRQKLSEKEVELDKKDSFQKERQTILDTREKSIQESEIVSQLNFKNSHQEKKESEGILFKAKEYESNSKEEIESRIKEVIKKETDLKYREIDVENSLKNIAESNKWLEKEKKHLEARQRALKVSEQINVHTEKLT